MLYPCQPNPFLHTFNPSSPSPVISSPPLIKGMEYLRDGFGDEMPAFGDGSWGVNGVANAVMGDDLFVDELLDFSNGFSEPEEPEEKAPEKKTTTTCSVSVSHEKEATVSDNSALTGKDDFGSFPESELTLPAEDLENLEWLSHFVEDSFSDYSPTGKLPPKPAYEPAVKVPCFTTPVHTKARTKRARMGVRVWPVLSSSFAESSSTTSSGSSASSTTSFSPFLGYPAAKKRKVTEGGGGGAAAQPRRCSHCGVTKTPQWRAGPLGSKTLCNACGVRFKSGRLLPEYRPACSPTFSSDLHSNNHRKVMEMRRKKEVGVFEELLI